MRMAVVVTANYPYGRSCARTRRGHDMTEARRKGSTGIVCPSLLCPWNVPPVGIFRGCRKVSAQGGISKRKPHFAHWRDESDFLFLAAIQAGICPTYAGELLRRVA